MFQEIINSAFQDIVSDELKKIEDSHDILWEYEGPEDAYEGDSEEILLEMQHMFYNDLISETGKPFTLSLLPIWRSWILMHCCGYLLLLPGSYAQAETWDEEEDEYLATLVSQNMLLNTEQVGFLSSRILVFPNLDTGVMCLSGAKPDMVSDLQARRGYGESPTYLLQHV